MPEIALQKLEAELASELVDEYTSALLDDNVIPPPPSHGEICHTVYDYDTVRWSGGGDLYCVFNL